MRLSDRVLISAIIVLVEMMIFFLPLSAFFAVYVLLARPRWFRDWINELYTD